MARPRVDLPPAAAILALADGEGRVAVKVTPGARTEGLEIADNRLLAKTRAKPKDGEATEAVLAMIASALGIARSRVTLQRGEASREKLIRIGAP
jgi:uncharacterized protein YggU (UPF0235/DUF167 family)